MGKDSSAPAAPDPATSASTQGNANVQGAIANAYLNNPNVTNPYGTSRTTVGGYQTIQMPDGTSTQIPTFNVNQTLAPAQQQILNSQNNISQGLLDTGQTALNSAQSALSKPFDLSSVGDTYNKAYAAQTSRLDPQWAQNSQSEQTQLINQGLRPGDQAYDNAMRDFGQQENDAYQQAGLAAIQTEPQTYQLAQSAYTEPLNIVNALRTGDQVQNPTFQNFSGSNIAAAPYSTAQGQSLAQQNNAYNAQVASDNATTQGVATVGAAGLSAYLAAGAMAF